MVLLKRIAEPIARDEGRLMGRPDKERRAQERVRLDLKVQVTPPTGAPEMLMSLDWSKSGVFLRTRSPLRLGTIVELAVVLRKPLGRQVMRGTVARSMSGGDREGMVVTIEGVPDGFAQYLAETLRTSSSVKRPS
jgi:hypothetical protein